MIRTRRQELNSYPGHASELYDLENDPREERNLTADPADGGTVADLKQSLLDWMITADENDQIAEKWLE
jgi:arylsulfatase A-like enzyme